MIDPLLTDSVGDMELLNPPPLDMDAEAILADTIHYHSRMLGRRTVFKQENFLYQALVYAIRERVMERWMEARTNLE